MSLKYYVLGIENNPTILFYKEKYYYELIKKLQDLLVIEVLNERINTLLKTENKDFILSPDQSSLINGIHSAIIGATPQGLVSIDGLIEKFFQEITLFLSQRDEELCMNIGRKIGDTDIRLTIVDNNPYNTFEAHPDHKKTGGVLGFGERSEEEWIKIYEKTFQILRLVDPGIYAELNQIIKKIVPIGTAHGVHNSASYKECIGHLYLGYTIDSSQPEINNLEAIIHESSHNKLNLILQFDPIILNDYQEKYYSAIRPDARHIFGVFLGYHAFAPTMYILMKAYRDKIIDFDTSWFEKIVLYYMKTKFLQKTVKKYAILTDLGKEISGEIDQVIQQMDILIKELRPSREIILQAKQRQELHFREVQEQYPHLQY